MSVKMLGVAVVCGALVRPRGQSGTGSRWDDFVSFFGAGWV